MHRATRMRFKRNQPISASPAPDLEKGSSKATVQDQPDEPGSGDPHARGEQPTDRDPHTPGEPTADDDSDNNDRFWKLFQDEAAAEAKWKVEIWKTELDSLLVFAGLFAAVVSAFLIDLRLHLRPDPQLIALNQIVLLLRNDTGPVEIEKPTLAVRGVGYMWYGSLVVTLIGALWGVLAKGWLGETLREPSNNPADGALERWRRESAAKDWHMDSVITAVPLLTQIGLAMFLSGFVVQSFTDSHGIGVEVLVYVVLGAIAYAMFTFLPYFLPECPYRTPLTRIFHLVPPLPQRKNRHDANTESKMKILMSRLNRSSNDEIFCSAAAILDAKLEIKDSKKWYRGVVSEKQAAEISDALFVRLKSFAHRIQQIMEAPSLPIPKGTARAGDNKQALVGNLYSPIEQGVACLRALLKSMEATMPSEGDKFESPWMKQDIDRQWRASKIFPETWRLLSLSIHITKLVAKNINYDTDDIVESDLESMIRGTYSDLTLRAISGTSACRGLLHGKETLQRLCALTLAMFIEVEATTDTDTPTQLFIEKDSDPAVDAGKIITIKLWSELVKIWKKTVVELLKKTHSEGEEENSFVKLLEHDLYKSDIQASVSGTIFEQLENTSWTTRKQAIQMLTTLMENDDFQEVIEDSGAIAKIIGMLEDVDEDVRAVAVEALSTFGCRYSDAFTKIMETENGITKLIATVTDRDSDVRAAALKALLEFSTNEVYQHDIKSSIPSILKNLDNEYSWRIREETVNFLAKLAESDIFQETLDRDELVLKLVAKLEDDDSDVQAAVMAAILALSTQEPYQNTVKLSIPTIINQLDHEKWSVREKAIQMLRKLFELDIFRETMNVNGVFPKIMAKLEDNDSDVCAAAIEALREFSTNNYDLYYSNIKASVPSIIKLLDSGGWDTRRDAIRLLTTLSEQIAFQETIKIDGVISKFIMKLEDDDDDVRTEAIKALVALAKQDYFKETITSENTISNLFGKVSDAYSNVRFAAIQAMSTLSTYETYKNEIESLVSISTFVEQLQDESWITRRKAIEILEQFAKNSDFHTAMSTENTVPILATILANDRDEDVLTTAAEAISVFGAEESFQNIVRSEKIVSKLITKLSDPNGKVRSAAQSTLLVLSDKVLYQSEIKSGIPDIMKQLNDKSWSTRHQGILILTKLSELPVFQETMKTEMAVAKLVDKLVDDDDDDVRAAAARALSVLGTKDPFQERMKSEKAISKLISKLGDEYDGVRSAAYDALLELGKQDEATGFLPIVVSTLATMNEPALRMEVYKFLTALKDAKDAADDAFLKQLDTDICKLVTQMTQKDLSFIFRSIAILSETGDEGLKGSDLAMPNPANKSARDAVDTVVRSKLVYDKNSPDRSEVALALSRLAKHDVFAIYMKPAIPGLTEAVNSNDRNVRSAAVEAISALATRDEFRTDLIPAVQKLTQQIMCWDEDDLEKYPLKLIEAMNTLVEHKEFRVKLKNIVPVLMDKLPHSPKDIRSDTAIDQDDDKNSVVFYKAICKLMSDLCGIKAVGRELVPRLTRVLSNMDVSLTEDLLSLVRALINFGDLTMNDRIALASSLRISPTGEDALDVQVCKLNMAALLDEAHKIEHHVSDYSLFFSAVLGHGNATVKSKLSTLIPRVAPDNESEVDK